MGILGTGTPGTEDTGDRGYGRMQTKGWETQECRDPYSFVGGVPVLREVTGLRTRGMGGGVWRSGNRGTKT